MINDIEKQGKKDVKFVVTKQAIEHLTKQDKKKVNLFLFIQRHIQVAVLTIAGP